MSIKKTGIVLFFHEALTNFKFMGSPLPSSHKLAQGLAQQVPDPKDGYILELGGGTGVITKGLIKQGFNPEQIIVIEQSKSLTEHLQKRFPKVRAIHGDASHIEDLLGEDAKKVATIISGLPMRTLPKTVVKQIFNQIDKVLGKDQLYLQFTYSWRHNYPYLSKRFKRIHSKYI